MVSGVVLNDCAVMLPFIFQHGLRVNTEPYIKGREKVVLIPIERVAYGKPFFLFSFFLTSFLSFFCVSFYCLFFLSFFCLIFLIIFFVFRSLSISLFLYLYISLAFNFHSFYCLSFFFCLLLLLLSSTSICFTFFSSFLFLTHIFQDFVPYYTSWRTQAW